MIRFLASFVLLFCSYAQAFANEVPYRQVGFAIIQASIPPSGITPFTALTTHFMACPGCSPAGNDGNSGVDAAHPWATPNHAVNCGDVIIAAAGDYSTVNSSGGFNSWGTVSNCPSTTGGIDGTGGIYFAVLLCGGASVGDCSSTLTNNANVFDIPKSNWAIEGWLASSPNNNSTISSTYFFDACSAASTLHHVAFINDIASIAGSAYEAGPCNNTKSFDYWAVVGSASYKGNQNGPQFCGGSINPVAPQNFDAAAGTHIYLNGNIVWKSDGIGCTLAASGNYSDGEAINVDSFDQFAYTGQTVISNHLIYTSSNIGINLFYAGGTGGSPIIVHNNSMYWNSITGFPVGGSYAAIQSLTATNPYTMSISKNLVLEPNSTNTNAGDVYGLFIGATYASWTIGGSGASCAGLQNYFFNAGASGNSAFNFATSGSTGTGTNCLTDPTFTNLTDLVNNQNGAPPSCTGKENVVQCVGGYDAVTGTLTTPGRISDLQPGCTNCAAKGYQLPSMACAADAEFPVWLKGIVYLHWTGSALQQKAGLASRPCGL